MSGGWRYLDIPKTSVSNINTKPISVVIFSVLVRQICVLDTKKLVFEYCFSFSENSLERPKIVLKWHLQREVLGTFLGSQFKHFP